MSEKNPRRFGTMLLALLASAGAVTCSTSSTQTPQVPTAFATMRLNSNGTLDTTTFNSAGTSPGIVITDLDPAQFDFATAVALQSDGSIIAAGQTVVNGQAAIAMIRYSTSGVRDTTFGGVTNINDIVRTVVSAGTAGASSIVVQPDDKILVAATTFNSPNSTTGFALLRYNADGTVDATFNPSGTPPGTATGAIGSGSPQDTVSLVLQGTNIIVAGADSSGSFVLARFTTAGALDLTFGGLGTGTVKTPLGLPGIGAMPPAIALQSDGSIVAAGGVGNFSTHNAPDVALVHYSPDGMLDTNFGGATGGIVITDVASTINYANAVAVQPDDKIVVAGHAISSAQISDIVILRYNAVGTLDTTFNNSGIVVQDLGGGFDNALSLALQPQTALPPKILVSGNSSNTIAVDLVVLRYNTDGSLDLTFGPSPNGLAAAAPIGPSNVTSANAITVQADGKIVTVGYD